MKRLWRVLLCGMSCPGFHSGALLGSLGVSRNLDSMSYAAWKAAGSEGKLSQSYTWCAHGRRCGTLFGGLVLVGGLTK